MFNKVKQNHIDICALPETKKKAKKYLCNIEECRYISSRILIVKKIDVDVIYNELLKYSDANL